MCYHCSQVVINIQLSTKVQNKSQGCKMLIHLFFVVFIWVSICIELKCKVDCKQTARVLLNVANFPPKAEVLSKIIGPLPLSITMFSVAWKLMFETTMLLFCVNGYCKRYRLLTKF